MKKPASLMFTPRGGWTVTIPQTGVTLTSPHPKEFLRLVHEHYENNGIPIVGGWQDEAWDMVCRQHPEIEAIDDGQETSKRTIAGEDIWRFLTVLWKSWESGAKPVPEAEQERRIDICITCPKMAHVTCAFGCGKLAEVLSSLTMGRSGKKVEAVHKASCGVCGCEISSVTAYPLEVLKSVDQQLGFDPSNYPSHCWKLGVNTADSLEIVEDVPEV